MTARPTQALRRDVAAATRMLVDLEILKFSGHISVRVPGTEWFLIPRPHDDFNLADRPLVAEEVPSLVVDSVHFVEKAATLVQAAQLGDVEPSTMVVQAEFVATFDRPKHVNKLWQCYIGRPASGDVVPREWLDRP